jgi:nicotinamidase/pyrazinamidase
MKALLIVDVQNDFIPGGALAVSGGDEIVSIINEIQDKFDFIVATQDWHPADHGSFASNHPMKSVGEFIDLHGIRQILWPEHCVQGSQGAEFHPDLKRDKWKAVFQKGTLQNVDSYSGFFDNNKAGDTGLSSFLKDNRINEISVCGLATDYCVKFTVLDGLADGFKMQLFVDATKAVNIQEGDFDLAIEEMENAGAIILLSSQFQ